MVAIIAFNLSLIYLLMVFSAIVSKKHAKLNSKNDDGTSPNAIGFTASLRTSPIIRLTAPTTSAALVIVFIFYHLLIYNMITSLV